MRGRAKGQDIEVTLGQLISHYVEIKTEVVAVVCIIVVVHHLDGIW